MVGGYGVKKGVDARKNYKTASEINNDAQSRVSRAEQRLSRQRGATAAALTTLGEKKFGLYDGPLREFVLAFSQLKHVNFSSLDLGEALPTNAPHPTDLSGVEFQAVDALKSALAGGAAGAGAGFMSFGAVGSLAAASTSTPIASLTGVAATNATLAWFGGGAISAGGYGMAVGTYVLGGIVAGPVLAVGGMVLDARARSAVEDAQANFSRAKKAVHQMGTARSVARAIQVRAEQVTHILERLGAMFVPMVRDLERIVQHQTDFRRLTRAEREHTYVAASFAKTLKNLMDTPLFDERGHVTAASAEALQAGQALLEARSAHA
jgi:hypothetical protein